MYDLSGRNVSLALEVREKKPRVPVFSKPHQRRNSIFDQHRNSETVNVNDSLSANYTRGQGSGAGMWHV